MIALVLAMVWARRGQAVTLALLSLFGVAAAVAAPAYLRAADRAVAAGQVEAAPPGERSLELQLAVPDRRFDAPSRVDPEALRITPGLTDLPGFGYVHATRVNTVGMVYDTREPTRLVHRQDVCAHLTVVAGRCLAGESDVVVDARTGLRPGQPVTVRYARFNPKENEFQPDGRPKTLLVTGVYEVTDRAEPYWGAQPYFDSRYPAFVTEATLGAMDLGATIVSVDGYAGPDALAVDRLPAVRAGFDRLRAVVDAQTGIELRSGLPGLLSRIDQGRDALHRVVPVLAVALVLLACLTIFLAAGYGTDGRRPELAVVALRGARAPQRWWLGAGENAVAIVGGGLLGCLAGQLLVNAVTAIRFPGVGADAGLSSLRWAPAALAAALLTALLAERRQLTTPVLELLRRAPAVRGDARAVAFEVAVLLLATAATVQLVVSGGALTGVGVLAAALVLLAAALLVARLLMRAITAWSRRALARGRLGHALAGLHLSRRPGGTRLLALLVAAVAVAGYAASAVDVAGRARQTQATLGVGADRVVRVAPVPAPRLLSAVRRADPDGRYAMAVVRLAGTDGAAPVLAVDTTRLAAVSAWPGDRRAAAAALRPAAPPPVSLAGSTVGFDITADGFSALPAAAVQVTSAAGVARLPLGTLRAGRHTYTVPAPVCADGCVVDAVHLFRRGVAVDIAGTLVLHGLPGSWRSTEGARAGTGATFAVNLIGELTAGVYLQPVDTPLPLPVATAGGLATPTVVGLDGRTLPVARDLDVSALPAAGPVGTLVDLEYADRYAVGAERDAGPEVWLSARAPADVLDRLRDAGLAPAGDVRASAVRAALDNDGPALGLLFYALVGGLAALLAAGALALTAAVDRSRRIEDLTALRSQGLRAGDLRRATLGTYPVLAAVAVVAGTLIGLGGWLLTGWALPLQTTLPVSRWPSAAALAGPAAVVLALLAGVALAAGRRTLRAITRG